MIIPTGILPPPLHPCSPRSARSFRDQAPILSSYQSSWIAVLVPQENSGDRRAKAPRSFPQSCGAILKAGGPVLYEIVQIATALASRLSIITPVKTDARIKHLKGLKQREAFRSNVSRSTTLDTRSSMREARSALIFTFCSKRRNNKRFRAPRLVAGDRRDGRGE